MTLVGEILGSGKVIVVTSMLVLIYCIALCARDAYSQLEGLMAAVAASGCG